MLHLDFLTTRNFRSCSALSIKLRPDLTVLVGENNGGKSNIVDAIRLLTVPLNGRRERYPEDDDLTRGAAGADFTIEGRFSGMSPTVKGLLISAVPDPAEDLAIVGMRYQTRGQGRKRGKTSYWAGRFDTAEPEPGATDLIRHVYLPPLRDALRALGSGSATRITALLQNFLQDGEEGNFLQHVRRQEAPHRVVTSMNTEIGAALGRLTAGVRNQSASVGFSAEALTDVARDLRFRLGDAGFDLQDIGSSGLGYANLLYVATVVVELAKAREADLTLFLVEEPEAHLHPQLQMLVLDFLLAHARQSSAQPPVAGQPEGRIQVIVTTHSPNLTAWVEPLHLVVIRSVRTVGGDRPPYHSAAISVASLGIKRRELEKVNRYLDVTRSALLFGNRALLVEGIAESVLLPAIARQILLRDDRAAWERFRGTVIVPIEGVDFLPYVSILLRQCNGATIADRVVVVTDADPSVPGNRKRYLETRARAWGAADKLSVFTNAVTLEHELYNPPNEAILKAAYLDLHRRSRVRWEQTVEAAAVADRAQAFVRLLSDSNTRKGDFAQSLAQRIMDGDAFTVPAYLRDAINRVAAA